MLNRGLCLLGVFCSLWLLHTLSFLFPGFSEPPGEKYDGNILFRAECSKVSQSTHHVCLWNSVLFPSASGRSFTDDGWTRHWLIGTAECLWESFYWFFFKKNSIVFYPRFLSYLVPVSSWWSWPYVNSDIGWLLLQTTTIALIYLADRSKVCGLVDVYISPLVACRISSFTKDGSM